MLAKNIAAIIEANYHTNMDYLGAELQIKNFATSLLWSLVDAIGSSYLTDQSSEDRRIQVSNSSVVLRLNFGDDPHKISLH